MLVLVGLGSKLCHFKETELGIINLVNSTNDRQEDYFGRTSNMIQDIYHAIDELSNREK